MTLEERQYPVIPKINRGDRRLGAVELGKGHLGVGVNEGLLVDLPNALQRADIEGDLGTEMPRMGGLDLASRFIILLFLLQGGNLRLRQNDAFVRYFLYQCFQALFETAQILSQQDAANVAWGDKNSLLSQFVADSDLTMPGISSAYVTTVSSIASSTLFFGLAFLRLLFKSASTPP